MAKEIDLAEVERLASIGLTMEQIAHNLGIATSTLYVRKNESPEFSEAIKRGQAKGIEAVANKVFENAMAGNVPSALFYLKARAGWRDTPLPDAESESDAPESVSLNVKDARKPDA